MPFGAWLGVVSRERERIIGDLSRLLDWYCLSFGGLVCSFFLANFRTGSALMISIGLFDEPHVQAEGKGYAKGQGKDGRNEEDQLGRIRGDHEADGLDKVRCGQDRQG